MADLYSTDFESDAVGSLPAGWTDGNGTTTVSAAGGGYGKGLVGSGGWARAYASGQTARADQESYVDFPLTVRPGAPGVRCGSGGSGYFADNIALAGLVLSIKPIRWNSGGGFTWLNVSPDTVDLTIQGSPTGSDVCRLSIRIVDSLLSIAVYKVGTPRPTSGAGYWSVTNTDLATGVPGVMTDGGAGSKLDNITWTDGADAAAAPTNSVLPSISGSTVVGQVLTASTGTWSGSPTGYTYQWKRDGVAISGATSSTYTLVTADIGATITVTVTATNASGSTAATSSGVGPVSAAAVAPTNSVAPTITGVTQVGQVLSASTGTWANGPTGYAYQWKRGGVAISGATGSTYTLVSGDLGATITVTVTASNAAGSASATSSGVGPITAAGSTQTIDVNNANLLWAPGAWDTIPVGTYGVTTKCKQVCTTGIHLRFRVLAATDISLLVDLSMLYSGATNGPDVRWRVGHSAWQYASPTPSTTSIALLTGGTPADVDVEIGFVVSPWLGSRFSSVAGQSLTYGCRVKGITINSGASMAPYSINWSKKVAILGDSITSGSGSGDGDVEDARTAWVAAMGPALGAVIGQIGFGGQGWVTNGPNSQVFPTMALNHAVDRARDLSGLDAVFVAEGTNDGNQGASDSSIRTAMLTTLPLIRTAIGTSCWLFVVVPVGGQKRSIITSTVAEYLAAHTSDTKTALIDIGTLVPTGYFDSNGASAMSSDGTHPDASGSLLIGGAIAGKALAAMGGTTTVPTPVPDPLWDSVIEDGLTAAQVLRLLLATAAGKTVITDLGSGAATVRFKSRDGSKDRIVGTMAGSARTAVTVDGA